MERIGAFITSVFNNIQLMQISDVLDILIVAYLIYKGVMFVRKNHAFRFAKGVAVILLVLLVSEILHLTMIQYFISKSLELGLIAVVILFQPELRRLLERLGTGKWARLLTMDRGAGVHADNTIRQVALAFKAMSASQTGALVVFERSSSLAEHTNTGTIVNAEVTCDLLRNIFFEPAPLHDGAVIIRDGKISAAGCMLPLSNNNTLSHDMGMRHRAAIGISEHSDAVVAVVSEETGAISVAINGMIKRHLDLETFEEILRTELSTAVEEPTSAADKFANMLSSFKVKKNDE